MQTWTRCGSVVCSGRSCTWLTASRSSTLRAPECGIAILIWPAWGAVLGLVLVDRGLEGDDRLWVLTGAGFLLVAAVSLGWIVVRRGEQ